MSAQPAFQFYVKDWITSTRNLSLEARGAHIDLMAWSWDNGPLPLDEMERARILGVTVAKSRVVWQQIAGRWVEGPGGFHNRRLEHQRQVTATYAERRSKAGSKGAAKRWQSHSSAMPEPLAEPIAHDSSAVCDLRSATATAEVQEHTVRPRPRETGLVNGSEMRIHGQHAWCSWPKRDGLCVPAFLHRELLGKFGRTEAELKGWYSAVVGHYEGKPVGADTLKFWRSEFEKFIGKQASDADPNADVWDRVKALVNRG